MSSIWHTQGRYLATSIHYGPTCALSFLSGATASPTSSSALVDIDENLADMKIRFAFLQRAIALRSLTLVSRQSRTPVARLLRTPSIAASQQLRFYTATGPRRQEAFHAQLESAAPNNARIPPSFPEVAAAPANPQNLTEKIFQRYAIGLAPGKTVKAGDFISIVT